MGYKVKTGLCFVGTYLGRERQPKGLGRVSHKGGQGRLMERTGAAKGKGKKGSGSGGKVEVVGKWKGGGRK